WNQGGRRHASPLARRPPQSEPQSKRPTSLRAKARSAADGCERKSRLSASFGTASMLYAELLELPGGGACAQIHSGDITAHLLLHIIEQVRHILVGPFH